jgi:hypothetical protein
MNRIKLLLVLLMFAGLANATTVYYVSATGSGTDGLSWETAYQSPAAALAGAPVAGDEVWVKQGTYVSATTLSWKTGINFYGGFVGTETERDQRSTDASLTILEGTNTNKVLNAPSMASPTTWDGFTIQKGLSTGGGGGVFMQKNAILQNCIVLNNVATNYGGGGIFVQGLTADADSIKIINCIVRNNSITYAGAAKRGGGGIYVKQGSFKAVIRGCTIENNVADGLANSASDNNGGGVYLADGTLENSIIRNNVATNKNASTQALSLNGKCQGGGVFIMPQTTTNQIIVRNCTITGNAANTSQGGGISIDPLWSTAVMNSPVLVEKTIIANNSAYRAGGAIMTEGLAITSTASYTFSNCVIANNESSSVAAGGGGVFVNNTLDYAGSVSFNNCTVVNNKMLTTNYGGAGIFYNNIKADITNSVFWGNGSVGTLAPYHVRVKNTLTDNKIINCAFDNRFVESQVSPTTAPADLTGLVILGLDNSGEESGVLYPSFVSPTNFVGKVITEADQTSFAAANWSITSASAFLNTGATLASFPYDITGLVRPQGTKYDIGAYEVPYYNTTVTFNEFGTVDSYATGAVVSEVKGKQLTFTITPNSLYKITSVLYNNVEVKGDMVGAIYTAPALSANSTLLVQFDLATGLDKTIVDFRCISANNGLEISGLNAGEEVTVFNITGVKMASKTAHSSNVSLLLPQGIYMVKVANSVKKVIVK